MLPMEKVWGWVNNFQSHPQSYWRTRPYSQENNYLHGIVHRVEGHRIGEAGASGFNNARFWFAGGMDEPPAGLGPHPVYHELTSALLGEAGAVAVSKEVSSRLLACCISNSTTTVTVPSLSGTRQVSEDGVDLVLCILTDDQS